MSSPGKHSAVEEMVPWALASTLQAAQDWASVDPLQGKSPMASAGEEASRTAERRRRRLWGIFEDMLKEEIRRLERNLRGGIWRWEGRRELKRAEDWAWELKQRGGEGWKL
jgi:hypothetical protein